MNDENRDLDAEVKADAAADEAEAAAGLIGGLQDEVDGLRIDLASAEAAVRELDSQLAVYNLASANVEPVGDDSLRALAATVRQCQKNGHPDLATHLDTLLTTLGAL